MEKNKNNTDHSKWAVTTDKSSFLFCIGDINRQYSQAKRGGGAVSASPPFMWCVFSLIFHFHTYTTKTFWKHVHLIYILMGIVLNNQNCRWEIYNFGEVTIYLNESWLTLCFYFTIFLSRCVPRIGTFGRRWTRSSHRATRAKQQLSL